MKNSFKIKTIKAREILDSRGYPTLEVELESDCGKVFASVPAGASKGKEEAVELRDGGKRYQGKGVLKAIKNIEKIIAPKLKGKEIKEQKELDEFLKKLDGTKNKSRLGANAILGVSLAVCRAGAEKESLPLWQYIAKIFEIKQKEKIPLACFNIINGGLHAGNDLVFQEFMVCPKKGAFFENLRVASEIYHKLKEIISKKYGKGATNLGDEGGFAPPIKFPEEAIELILKSASLLNYEKKISIFLDVAASQFFDGKKYKAKFANFSSEKLAEYYLKLMKKYPIEGIEDPFAQDDFESWQNFMKEAEKLNPNFLIIGDDLLVSNPERIKMAKENRLCNGAIIKLNQIGTVTEAGEAAKLAKFFGWKIVVSHRSGETNDDFIADFAVGIGADFIKAGAPARGERVAKYNRLLKIEKELL